MNRFGFAAIAVTISFLSFTNSVGISSPGLGEFYRIYSLSPFGNPFNPNDYMLEFSQPYCEGYEAVCCIVAPEDPFNPGRPMITMLLELEIWQALTCQMETLNVKLKYST